MNYKRGEGRDQVDKGKIDNTRGILRINNVYCIQSMLSQCSQYMKSSDFSHPVTESGTNSYNCIELFLPSYAVCSFLTRGCLILDTRKSIGK